MISHFQALICIKFQILVAGIVILSSKGEKLRDLVVVIHWSVEAYSFVGTLVIFIKTSELGDHLSEFIVELVVECFLNSVHFFLR